MINLQQAIDAVFAFLQSNYLADLDDYAEEVKSRWSAEGPQSLCGELTKNDVNKLTQLAEEVYMLAHKAGVGYALPQVPELTPEVGMGPESPPAQFETKLNLPGDWIPRPTANDYVYSYVACNRWWQDMRTLRKLATDGRPDVAAQLLGEDGHRVMEVAKSSKSADTKMRLIFDTNPTCVGWESPKWADLLSVSDAAIRRTAFWKELQAMKNRRD